MCSTRFRNQIFIISAFCFVSISAFTLPGALKLNSLDDFVRKVETKMDRVMNGNGTECTMEMIAMLANEDSGDLGDFHGKSDFEKTVALLKEYREMLRNGNDVAKHFEERLTFIIDRYIGGEAKLIEDIKETYESVAEYEEYIKQNKIELPSKREKNVETCVYANGFKAIYNITKDSISKGRLGHSKTFLPMVKDVFTSVDLKKGSFLYSKPALVAFTIMTSISQPDFLLAAFNLMTYFSEEKVKQYQPEMKHSWDTFDPETYMALLTPLRTPESAAEFVKSLFGDEAECTKKIVAVLANEPSGDLGDFHGQSELEKMKALRKEFFGMLRNGSNATKHFEERYSAFVGKRGGEAAVDELYEMVLQQPDFLKQYGLTSCMVAGFFEGVYNITKDSISEGRLGHSETFLPMIKDMVTSINLQNQTFMDSPPAYVATFYMLAGAIPDVVLSYLSLASYIPEDVMEKSGAEMRDSFQSFDTKLYMNAFNSMLE